MNQPRPIDGLLTDVAEGALQVHLLGTQIMTQQPDLATIVYDAEWHMRGVTYHFARMAESYQAFSSGVAGRARLDAVETGGPAAIVMPAPEYQQMMFDFYALVNLVRISLDSLRRFLQPLFITPIGQIPKSITDIMDGITECPVYGALKGREDYNYLCDLRNCIVHFRTLATSDKMVVFGEGMEAAEQTKLLEMKWFAPMAKATYRYEGDDTVVNVFVPDIIFERDSGSKRLAKFTYARRWNILSAGRDFVNLVRFPLLMTLNQLLEHGYPVYTWHKERPQRVSPKR